MSKQIIKANPDFRTQVDRTQPHINVAEFFTDTIQGEGVSTGVPATFLRVQHCLLNCIWCDSTEVWKKGNPYTPEELVDLMLKNDVLYSLTQGGHLVLTGGSPLKQQDNLTVFLEELSEKLEYTPFIEVENECVVLPTQEFQPYISQWNNSPKLANSGETKERRYKPEVLKHMSRLINSWFKFVVASEEDWNEIEEDFITPGLIKRSQIILMPCGENREELNQTREIAVNLAIRENVRFSDRLHVTLWDKKTGV